MIPESTLKRHGYYCRSKRDGKATRVRSCVCCAKVKAKCDKRRPKCSKCISKGLECHYPLTASENTRSVTQQNRNENQQEILTTPSVAEDPSAAGDTTGQTANNSSDIDFDNVTFIGADFTSLGEDNIDWQGPEMDFTGLWEGDMDVQAAPPHSSPHSSPQPFGPVPMTDQDLQTFIPLNTYVALNSYIPRAPGNGIRTLVQRARMKTSTQRIANLILQNLRSYPLSILHHNTLPPYIHPSLISQGVDNTDMEPLTNCISLVRMLNNGFQGSRKLFWKNVQMECERLCDPV